MKKNMSGPSPVSYSFADCDQIDEQEQQLSATPPPPRSTLLAPTQVSLTSSNGGDDVHPLAMAALVRKKQQQVSNNNTDSSSKNTHEPGTTASTPRWAIENMQRDNGANNDGMDQMKIFTKEHSLELSDMTSLSSHPPSNSQQLGKSAAPTTPTGSNTNGKTDKLTPKQQSAMDNFLQAQMSGNPLSKNEMWKELVKAMKADDPSSHNIGSNNFLRSNGSGNIGGVIAERVGGGGRGKSRKGHQSSSNKSWSSGKDDILGELKIGASDAVSIESGLTSEYTGGSNIFGSDAFGSGKINTFEAIFGGGGGGMSTKSAISTGEEGWDAGRWDPTPHPSPTRKDDKERDNEDGGEGGEADNKDRKGQGVERTMTPPNVPMLQNIGTKNDLPMVSPLSVDGSFDTGDDCRYNGVPKEKPKYDDEVDEENPLNVTGATTISSNSKSSGGKNKKKALFFDIGETFANNTKHLWNDPTLSLADLSDGDDEEEYESLNERRKNSLPASAMLPSPRRSPRLSPEPLHSSLNGSFLAASNEGEVMEVIPFKDVVDQQQQQHPRLQESEKDETSFNGFAGPALDDEEEADLCQSIPLSRQKAMRPENLDETFDSDIPPSPGRLGCDLPVGLDAMASSSGQPTRSKRKTKLPREKAAPTLEEQILNVLQQQPESHVVENVPEDEAEDVIQEEELFGRSSPMPSKKSKVKSSGRVKSGTVGSSASAQDILRELRSETPCTLQSGSTLNSSSRSRTRNKPPLGSISIGGRRGQGKESVVESVTTTPAFPSEESSEQNGSSVRSPTPTLALAPSRRDLPRPGRIARRSASEPTTAPSAHPASATKGKNTSMSSRATTAVTTTTSLSSTTTSPATGKELTGAAPVQSSRVRSRLFPCTNPTTTGTERKSTNPFDNPPPSTNPFDSPPRIKMSQNKEDPFEDQSSPIPMEKSDHNVHVSVEPCSFEDSLQSSNHRDKSISNSSSKVNAYFDEQQQQRHNTSDEQSGMSTSYLSERAIAEQSNTNESNPSSKRGTDKVGTSSTGFLLPPSRLERRFPVTSPRSSPRSSPSQSSIDEIRASIDELKNAGVGGLHKATSTLVRNEETGRFVIRDVDDVTKAMPHLSDDAMNGAGGDKAKPDNSTTPISSMMKNQIMSESVMDDEAVEAAIRATMECLSTTSDEDVSIETEGEESKQQQLGTEEEEEDGDDLFVIRRPQRQLESFKNLWLEWGDKWSAFETSPEVCDDDDFDIKPSESMDEWVQGDDGQWDCDEESWGVEKPLKGEERCYPSPTSVANSRKPFIQEREVEL